MPDDASKLFVQCAAMYGAFAEQAEDTDEGTVWSGRIMELVDQTGIPRGGYKRAIDRLIEMRCIEQVSRGFRGDSRTVYLLRYPPTPEVWDTFVKSSREGLTGRPTFDSLVAEVREIQANIGGMSIVDAFRELENRIKVLEQQQQQHDKSKKENDLQ